MSSSSASCWSVYRQDRSSSKEERCTMKRSTFTAVVGGALWSGAGVPAFAQAYPTKPVLAISWSAAGSPVDVMAREVSKVAPKYLKQNLVVEDKTGGGTANAIAYLLGRSD